MKKCCFVKDKISFKGEDYLILLKIQPMNDFSVLLCVVL